MNWLTDGLYELQRIPVQFYNHPGGGEWKNTAVLSVIFWNQSSPVLIPAHHAPVFQHHGAPHVS